MCSQQNGGITSAWLTDGSPVRFLDTVKLKTKPSSFLPFLKESYEGLLDPNVFIGYGCIAWEEGGHDTELEWALIFEQPIGEISISEGTPCTLQGMIEGKNLSALLGTHSIPWKPASLSNNVIATLDPDSKELTGGVKTTLGQLQEDLREQKPIASMHLSFPCINGSILPTRTVSSAVLEKFSVDIYKVRAYSLLLFQ